MKKGFTLIELLAVLVILVIIMAISSPIILGIIEDARKSSNLAEVEFVLDGAEKLYVQSSLDESISVYFDGETNIYNNINLTSNKPKDGVVKIDNKGQVYLSIYLDNVCYTKDFTSKEIIIDETIKSLEECVPFSLALNTEYTYEALAEEQEFIVEQSGYYYLEAWGAQGGNSGDDMGSYGAYTSGYIYLNKGDIIYIQVGGQGKLATSFGDSDSAGYNGGAVGSNYPGEQSGSGSGGATDFRLESGNWDADNALSSRIMVAAGGVGIANWLEPVSNPAPGGGLIGYDGQEYLYPGMTSSYSNAKGSNQTESGTEGYGMYAGVAGTFGMGGNPQINLTGNTYSHGSGGSGGYYGGSGGSFNEGVVGSGSSGSSYISGHTGAVAIKAIDDQSPKDGCATGTTDNICSIHYSGLFFENTLMIDGYGYYWTNEKQDKTFMPKPDGTYYELNEGHTGNGYAKVTYVGKTIEEVYVTQIIEYTGTEQEIILEKGTYDITLYGAQGGASLVQNSQRHIGGKGAIVSAKLELDETLTLYAQVGGKGGDAYSRAPGPAGYNGGGAGGADSDDDDSGGGGGATDLRLVSGSWNNAESLNSRIIVAAGGAGARYESTGAPGGDLNAYDIYHTITTNVYQFGIGQDGVSDSRSGGAGGGGGYFGGIGGNTLGYGYHSSGGTSYASGCTGCKSVTSLTDSTMTENNVHYSNISFTDINMNKGQHTGNGLILIQKIN